MNILQTILPYILLCTFYSCCRLFRVGQNSKPWSFFIATAGYCDRCCRCVVCLSVYPSHSCTCHRC